LTPSYVADTLLASFVLDTRALRSIVLAFRSPSLVVRWIFICRGASALMVAAMAIAQHAQCADVLPESGPGSLTLPPPPADFAAGMTRLPPVYSNEEELLRLEAEATRIIALDEALHGNSDNLPQTTLCMAWLAAGGANGFGTADLDLNRSWHWQAGSAGEPVTITPGVGLHLWNGPSTLDLPPRVYDLYLDLSWRFISRDCWGVAGGITPGFYGDFARFDGNAFQLTGWLTGDWTLSQQWSLVAGLAYVRQLDSHLLPIGGAIWRPSDDLQVDLLFPRPRVAWRWFETPDDDVWLNFSGNFGGGAWSVDDGAGGSVLLQYSDLRLSFGAEIAGRQGRVATIEAGLAFSRDISVESTSLATPDSTFFLQATLAY
jgi:hypothetical protein